MVDDAAAFTKRIGLVKYLGCYGRAQHQAWRLMYITQELSPSTLNQHLLGLRRSPNARMPLIDNVHAGELN